MTARLLAIVAGALILAAVAHVTVVYTGGYGTPHAYLTLAVAFGVACGSVFCGMAWSKGASILALAFSFCIVSGEAYKFFQSANRLMAATEAAQAPKREHANAFAKANEDVKIAEAAVVAAGSPSG
jgi:hypothetical protein